MKGLTFCHLNFRSLCRCMDELRHQISLCSGVDRLFLSLSETWLDESVPDIYLPSQSMMCVTALINDDCQKETCCLWRFQCGHGGSEQTLLQTSFEFPDFPLSSANPLAPPLTSLLLHIPSLTSSSLLPMFPYPNLLFLTQLSLIICL